MEEKHFILKYGGNIREGDEGDVTFSLRGIEATTLPHTPGWLTGESAEAQGIETGMPNLPQDLQLPALNDVVVDGRVQVMGPATVRITIAPPDHQLWSEPSTFPGILVTDTNGDRSCDLDSDDQRISVGLAGCRLVLNLNPFSIELLRNEVTLAKTGQRLRQVAGFPMAPPVLLSDSSVALNFEMDPDEKIFGFGEQFSRFEKNGQELVLEVNDALGTGTGRAYKPVPFWHSSNGYSALLNTGAIVRADIGHSRPAVLGLSIADTALDIILFAAETPKERLRDYTALTGRAPRPDPWAFGYWMGRCRYHSNVEMLDVAREMRHQKIPADVLHCDPDWLIVDRLNTDFIWNEKRFGSRRKFIEDLRKLNFRLSMWELPYLDPTSPIFEEAKDKGLLLKMSSGDLAAVEGTPTPDGRPRAIYDVTNPNTIAWLKEKEKPFFDDGLAVIKTDFGEGVPAGSVAVDGTPLNYIHNLFPLRYNGAIYDISQELSESSGLVWGRSGWAGSQRYPGQWGGDAESTVVGMQATLRGGLSYAVSAPGFWSHDIGGFYGPELTPELYIRWTQLGAFSPLMRAHGLRPREPWAFGEDALSICRKWIRLRYSLLPYIWQVAGEVEKYGLPFIRPLWLEVPDDPVVLDVDDEFFFGPSLLVAPIFDDSSRPVRRRVYLPRGVWYDFFTEQRFVGPQFVDIEAALDEMPIFVRDGAVIPRVNVGEETKSTDDLLSKPWRVDVWGASSRIDLDALDGFDSSSLKIAEVVRHGSENH